MLFILRLFFSILFTLFSFVVADAQFSGGGGSANVTAATLGPLGVPPTINQANITQFGDSRTYNGMLLGTNGTDGYTRYMALNGYQTWLQSFANGRLVTPAALQFGIAGDTLAGMRARLPSVIAAMKAWGSTSVIFWGGTNSAAGGVITDSGMADTAYMLTQFAQNQIHVYLIDETPRGNSTYPFYLLAGSALAQWYDFHRWLMEYGATQPNVTVVDDWAQSVIYNTTAAEVQVVLTPDGLHPGALFHQTIMGPNLWSAMQSFMPNFIYSSNQDNGGAYDATNNPRGNLILNGMMTGTGGSLATGLTGVLADSWTTNVSSGWSSGTGMTAVGSKVAYTNGEWQQIAVGGTIGASTGAIDIRQNVTLSNLSNGDIFRAYMTVEIDGGFSGLATVYGDLIFSSSGNSYEAKCFHATTGTSIPVATYVGATALHCITPELNVTASILTGGSFRIGIQPLVSSTLSATIRIGNVRVEKIIPGPLN